MNSFKSHFNLNNNKGDIVKKRRHMGLVPDVSTHTKTGGKTVPEMWKAKHSNQKVKSLLNNGSGHFTLNDVEVKQIEKEFPPVKYDPHHPKKLGNTGITLYYDETSQAPAIKI